MSPGSSHPAGGTSASPADLATPGESQARQPVFACRGIYKFFGGLQALATVDLDIYAGEVIALVGDNGAGKSTFTRIVSGFEKPDAGEIVIDGHHFNTVSRKTAERYGIESVPQDLALCDNLSASMNVVLGRPPLTRLHIGRFGVVDRKKAASLTRQYVSAVGTNLSDYDAPTRSLSGGQRQAIAIGRAIMRSSRILIFDEPTAALGLRQRERTLQIIRDSANNGIATLVVSHNFEEMMSIVDRVVAFRLGHVVMDTRIENTDLEKVRSAMEGTMEVQDHA